MKLSVTSSLRRRLVATLLASFTCLAAAQSAAPEGAADPALLDDFSEAGSTHRGAERLLITDKDFGSQSHASQACKNGALIVKGELVPGRGVPAFISLPLLLTPDAKPQDVSRYEGVRVRLKLGKGIITLQVSSAEVTNFDYHTSAPLTGKAGEFQEVRIPFAALKRAWSEQTPLNLQAITSVNLVAFGTARAGFSYELDEIGFY